MCIRPATEGDLVQVAACPLSDPVQGIDGAHYLTEQAAGRCRPEWSWLAVDAAGTVRARALWWGLPGREQPLALDCLWVRDDVEDPATLATDLLAAALAALRQRGLDRPPAYELRLHPQWRRDAATTAAVAWRRRAAAHVGLTDEVERLRVEWTPSSGVPPVSRRLVFTEEPDDEAVLAVFRRVARESLDVATRRGILASGEEAQARADMRFYLDAPGERAWWRLAGTPQGELIGLAIPSATAYGLNVGYLGVVDEHRGRGYVDDLLGEITRQQAERGAERITATTDLVNTPMAAAFARGGYRTTEVRLVLSSPP